MKLKTKYKIDTANELYTLNYNIAYWLRLRAGAYQLYRFRVSLRPPKHIAYLALPNYYLSLSAFPFLRSIFLVIFLATKQSRKHAYLAFEVTALSLSQLPFPISQISNISLLLHNQTYLDRNPKNSTLSSKSHSLYLEFEIFSVRRIKWRTALLIGRAYL